jgi:hypothetical protein
MVKLILITFILCQAIANIISPVLLQQFDFVSVASDNKQVTKGYNQTGSILVNYTDATTLTPKLYVHLSINSNHTDGFAYGNFF